MISQTQQILESPLIFTSGKMKDIDLIVGERFVPTSVCAALYLPGRDTILEDVQVLTTFQERKPEWETVPILKAWAGVRAAHTRNLIINGLHIRGFPAQGLVAYGLDTARLERMSATLCASGFLFSPDGIVNHNLVLDQISGYDMWWPPPTVAGLLEATPSKIRPGGWMGGDVLAGYFTESRIQRVDAYGEIFCGVKLVNPTDLCLIDVLSPSLMIEGSTSNVAIRRLLLDKRRGEGAVSERGNALQISNHPQDLDFETFWIFGGRDGNAIELAGNSEASFRDGVISGFNGTRGGEKACALRLRNTSRVNTDFTSQVRFFNQDLTVVVG